MPYVPAITLTATNGMLCNEYDLYLVDEGSIESHRMQTHKDAILANNPDWELPFMQCISRMVLRDRNIPAIIT